jgi:hypothetical protein
MTLITVPLIIYFMYYGIQSKKWHGAEVSAASSPVQHPEFIDLTTMFTFQTSFKKAKS